MTLALTAVFESWLIGDGDYPPLEQGMLVKLSFTVSPVTIAAADESADLFFENHGNAEYAFCAEILRIYAPSKSESRVIVLSAREFRFYVEAREPDEYQVGGRLRGEGTLMLDYYRWVEGLLRRPKQFPDPPDLFYTLKVTRILEVGLPEKFISRSERGTASPTSVPPADFGEVREVQSMRDPGHDFQFYLVDFVSSAAQDVPLTFT